MFCVYTTPQALKLFCSVGSARGHCLFLTCLYTTQGVMTSRIVRGTQTRSGMRSATFLALQDHRRLSPGQTQTSSLSAALRAM